ncbi:penicillin-binding protein 2 [candidate division WOR-1 bacterium RIFOXYB2_FULL_42_35]|uniref:Penicillin-binding protein 2 n=1 Tax=candidate division WOR-1 bacterium RIFOXYC2_FULL_41_25 TaxID=1802586 RepID=A0A1F4TMB6_UNCSA|nr:MAG: penicillin-binding protein 2 [candidate division WOR-1 bacterium RIFOXYA2_FULL_41_14]OGC22475.1 MAG: penicillin-binding protein 2 [candidate division WOR-1 bacterium RIFOXYB2_FULL_42_35]OGC33213.1 MAG: penicillin-binding protein 2 [candidate division WOR-1 bacterium RIFOXYC2_FULL_41_25]
MNNNRINTLIIAFVLIFTLLFLRLVYLQVVHQQKYTQQAIENAAKTVRDPAPRGIIYDRNGKVLVENQPFFSVHVLPYVLSVQPKAEQTRILRELGELLGEEIEYKVTALEPIIIKENISIATAIKIEEKRNNLPGVVVISRPARLYPFGSLAAHVLGYVGEIEAADLQTRKRSAYQLQSIVGKAGVEKKYDEQIRGVDGGKKIEVDVYGTPLRIIESLDPVPGEDVTLTLDIEMQKKVEDLIGQQEGAVVVMDANNGQVLAMASHPTYDPNVFISPQENWRWNDLKKKRFPFVNRALAIYPPGSVFKVITLTAALEEGLARSDEVINCKGYYQVNHRLAKCWLKGGHGPITVKEGLVWSCDVVFYELGKRLGPELLAKYAIAFGLGSQRGIDLPNEKLGTVPTKDWKNKYLKDDWYAGDSINYGIGQGFLEVTPLQMAVLYGSLANGDILQPYVVSMIKDKEGKVIYQGKKNVVAKAPIKPENLKILQQALREVVRRGTGVAVNVAGLPAAGKTGTAENPGKPHAWFVCYAPYDSALAEAEIVISVFIAHGEHGDRASAYVARDILKWYKANRLKKTYPEEKFEEQYVLHNGRKVPYRSLH